MKKATYKSGEENRSIIFANRRMCNQHRIPMHLANLSWMFKDLNYKGSEYCRKYIWTLIELADSRSRNDAEFAAQLTSLFGYKFWPGFVGEVK